MVGWKHTEESRRRISENRTVTAKGERHGQSVLTTEEVLRIVELSGMGVSQRSLAESFGVSKGTVTAVLKGWTWGHVTGIVGSRNQVRSS